MTERMLIKNMFAHCVLKLTKTSNFEQFNSIPVIYYH